MIKAKGLSFAGYVFMSGSLVALISVVMKNATEKIHVYVPYEKPPTRKWSVLILLAPEPVHLAVHSLLTLKPVSIWFVLVAPTFVLSA